MLLPYCSSISLTGKIINLELFPSLQMPCYYYGLDLYLLTVTGVLHCLQVLATVNFLGDENR